jgi:hypothetical protein
LTERTISTLELRGARILRVPPALFAGMLE